MKLMLSSIKIQPRRREQKIVADLIRNYTRTISYEEASGEDTSNATNATPTHQNIPTATTAQLNTNCSEHTINAKPIVRVELMDFNYQPNTRVSLPGERRVSLNKATIKTRLSRDLLILNINGQKTKMLPNELEIM
jgi:CO dehydrogenase/acetyl-CoA synthase epsilon subunit